MALTRIMVGWRHRIAGNLLPPSPGSKNTPKKFEQQSNSVRRRVGATEGLQGVLVEQQVDGRGHINR